MIGRPADLEPRRKSTGCAAAMIFTPFGETPIIGILATPPPSPAPTRAPPSRSRSCAPRQSRSQFGRKRRKRYPTTRSGEAFVLQPLSPARTSPAARRLALNVERSARLRGARHSASRDCAPTPGNSRDVHSGFSALRKDPRLLLVGPIPPLASPGDQLDPPVAPSCLASSMTPSRVPARSPTIPFHSCR